MQEALFNRLNSFPACKPPVFLRGGHLQTLLGYFLPSASFVPAYKSVTIPTTDGEQLTGRLYSPKSSIATTVALFHGLGGSAESGYLQRIGKLLFDHGFEVLLMNHRGVLEGQGLALKPYHSGRGEDLSDVVCWLRSRSEQKSKRVISVGFSLSGSALLNLLTKNRGVHQPDFAVVVNPPSHLASASQVLSQGLNKIYDWRFVRDCKRLIKEKIDRGELAPIRDLGKVKTLRGIDEVFTSVFSGFKDANDYYEQCSTSSKLSEITTPTLLMSAEDDPFIPWIHLEAAKSNPNVCVRIEKQGGHLGYLEGLSPKGRWLDRTVVNSVMEFERSR